jgi:hypothetical protein
MMFRLIAFAALFLALPAAASDDRTWNFRVMLDNREIGEHQFTLGAAGDDRELRSEARFDVRLLFVNAYRYRHLALERWNGNCLRSLVAHTETNGETLAVNAETRDGRLVVVRPAAREAHDGCVMSFAYWNPQILKARQLLNSQTGELLPVQVTPQGEETLPVRGEPRAAQRYRIQAPGLEIDLWYADDRWVALQARAAGGRRLRYELM